jgi:hypothetical protein
MTRLCAGWLRDHGFISERRYIFLVSEVSARELWGPTVLLLSVRGACLPRGKVAGDIKPTIHLHLVTGFWILVSFPHRPWRATLMYELSRLQIVGKFKKCAVKYQTPSICCSCRPPKDTVKCVKNKAVTFRMHHTVAMRLWVTVDGL